MNSKHLWLLCIFAVLPLYALAKHTESPRVVMDTTYSCKAWEMFENNQNSFARFYQERAIQSALNNRDSTYLNDEAILEMTSDLILFESDIIGAREALNRASKLTEEFNAKQDKSPIYYLHLARTGYYYCLAENFELADSLTRIAYDKLETKIFSPRQTLEIYAYRAASLWGKTKHIFSLDYDSQKEYKKVRKNYEKKASTLIEQGLKYASSNKLTDEIFSRYLFSMKESIMIDNINAYLYSYHHGNDSEFKIRKNTSEHASAELNNRYNDCVRHAENGQIMEALRFLEPLAMIALKTRGNTATTAKLFSLVSDCNLKLNNYHEANRYALIAQDIDSLCQYTFRDSVYHTMRINEIELQSEKYDSIKTENPLHAFEQAIMAQGSAMAQDARFFAHRYAIGNYLDSGHNQFDFDQLVNELIIVNGKHSIISDPKYRMFTDYEINPYITLNKWMIHGIDLNAAFYYQNIRRYSPTLAETKKIILDKIHSSKDLEEKSRFYHYLAKYHFYNEDINEAIKAQRNHFELELLISRNNYNDRVLKAQETLSLLYMLGMWNGFNKDNHKQVRKYQALFVQTGEEYISNVQKYVEQNFMALDARGQKELWLPLTTWFYYSVPYMGIDGRAAECIYDNALFSKGLLLSASTGKIPTTRWREIRDELHEGDMAIEFINFKNVFDTEIYYALTITPNCTSPSIYPLFSDYEYQNVTDTRVNIYENSNLNNLIYRPIEIPENVRNIYFSPTGILHTIAIENIVDSLGNRACDKWNMYRLSSTRELVNHKTDELNRAENYSALIIGDLDYDCAYEESDSMIHGDYMTSYDRLRGLNRKRVEALKFSRPEIDSIASITSSHQLRTILISGTDGTEETFKYYAQDSINILHFSTHGFYYSDEKIKEDGLESDAKYNFLFKKQNFDTEDLAMMRSALVMTGGNNMMRGLDIPDDREDGLLTAMEISQMSLNHCNLVSLSACETALGKVANEGVFGLQRGFKQAGAKSILMSLWEVPDEATSILMKEFYKNLFNGQTKIESLRNAQYFLRNDSKYSDPINWAGWIILDGLN